MNKHNNACGVSKTLRIIGSKWTLLIIKELIEGKKRFGEMETLLETISPRTLSLRLQQLEKFGLVNKKIFKEIPLHVEYSLTSKGKSLSEIIDKMREWGDKTHNTGIIKKL